MVTIKDIANECGVSTSLVSKALNGYTDIGFDTKQKIFETAQRMGYFPNANARNLARSKADKIGVIIRANDDTRFIDEINMIYAYCTFKRANELKYDITLVFSEIFENKTDFEISNYLKSEGITGVIMFGLSLKDDKFMSIYKDSYFKKVLLDIPIHNETTSSVSIDDISAQYEIISSNYSPSAHKRFCYLSGPTDDITTSERKKGMELFAHENDIHVDFYNGEYRDDLAFNIAEQNPDYDAYICANDMMAIGVSKFFEGTNTKKLITGFDGIKLLDYVEYDFPTVIQDFHTKSKVAVDKLVELFEGEKPSTTLVEYKIKK